MSVPRVAFTYETLPNGLRYILAPDPLAPVVAVNLWYGVGSKNEVEGRTGFAHLFEHVMFQGSAHVSKAEHISLVQAAGGTMNGTTWLDRTNYFETLPSHQLDLALWLEADRMATLLDALNQENLDNQREVVKNEKRWSYDNQPYGLWSHKLQANLFPPDHPYHHPTIGSMEDLDAASVEDVASFFRTHYVPGNAVLSVVGDFDPAEARASIERYFAPIPVAPAPPPLPEMSLPLSLGGEVREVVADRVPLTRIYIGFRAPVFGDPRLRALEIGGQILAGGKGSRLHRRLVREERIAQDIAFFAMGFVGGASIAAGWATVRPGIDPAEVEAAYLEELDRIAREPVTADELERAHALIETESLSALQRVEDRADQLSMYAVLFDDPDRINRELEGYLAVTAEDVRAVCADVFRPDNRTVITYVPAGDAPPEDAGEDGDGTDEEGPGPGPIGASGDEEGEA